MPSTSLPAFFQSRIEYLKVCKRNGLLEETIPQVVKVLEMRVDGQRPQLFTADVLKTIEDTIRCDLLPKGGE